MVSLNTNSSITGATVGVLTTLLVVMGCGSPKGSAPDKDVAAPPPTGTLAVTATVSGTAGAQTPPLASGDPAANEAPKEIPTLVLERFKTATFNPDKVYAIDGAVVVVFETFKEDLGVIKLGRVVGDTIEPFGRVGSKFSATGGRGVTNVGGYYPDGVDVYTRDMGGRIYAPGVYAATGKGKDLGFGGAGGGARIDGVARVGETTLLSGWDQFAGLWALELYRGPPHKIVRKTRTEMKCLPPGDEAFMWMGSKPTVAVDPRVFSATRAGTILSLGQLCRREGTGDLTPVAEIWTGNDEKSRIEDLSSVMGKSTGFGWGFGAFLGKGDEMWYGAAESEYVSSGPLLHYKDGHFEMVAPPGKQIVNMTAAPSGELYVSDGETLFRRDDGKWTPIARFDWPRAFETFAVYEGTVWVSTNDQVFRLKPGRGVEPRDDCPSPFVYLQDVKPERAAKERYPNTTAAIASFPEAADLSFQAFTEGNRPRIGVSVKSNAQGKALIEHLRPLLPDISPKLVCYAPDKPRKIPIPAKKK